jgi:serine/threonine protein phosphatase PrpC
VRLGGDAIVGARAEQQDAFAVALAQLSGGRSARLAVVVDGMGGHAGGAIAAEVALVAFTRAAAEGRWPSYAETLRGALDLANLAIAARVDAEPRLRGMGCTLVAAVFDGADLWAISVGDSLLLRVSGDALERLNADHSMAPLALGATAMDGGNHQRHLLRSALTGAPIPLVDERRFSIAGETRLVLASDGLLTLTPAAILATLLAATGDPEQQARALLQAVEAEAQPDQDNCTVILVESRAPAGGRRRFAPVAGALLLAGGLAALALAWWSSAQGIAPARRGGAGAPPAHVAAPPAGAVRRGGYPLADAAPTPPRTAPPTPARSHAPNAERVPPPAPALRPHRPPLTLDLPALIGGDDVTGPPAAAARPAPPAPAPDAPATLPPPRLHDI